MPIITLTTDLGITDHYVGAVKAAILRQLPEASVVDITHQIPAFNVRHAAFVLRNCYQEFPQGTIHIVGVDAEAKIEAPHIAIYANNHYFVGAENGIFSLILDVKPDKIVELNISQDSQNLTFPTKDIFVKAACHIARGGTLEVIGNLKENFSIERASFKATFDKDSIRGSVIHVDSYGNAITNIRKDLFKQVAKGRNFSIHVGNRDHYVIHKIHQKYTDVAGGEAVALFISTGQMEIAMNEGSASTLMGLHLNDIIRIEFHA
jgi:S-adenosyl-L-methionine hydrolase (adenosine-forming)